MKVNWKVRIRNKHFWLTIIPAVAILAQTVASACGVEIDLSETQGKLLAVVDALFVVLAIIGVVNDPTTDGMDDSELAMTYETPRVEGDGQLKL